MDWGSYLAQQALMVPSDGSSSQANSLVGAEVDFFYLDGEACCQDVDRTLSLLRDQTQGEEILGAIMFICSGRGPRQGHLIREDMMDATRWMRHDLQGHSLMFHAWDFMPAEKSGRWHLWAIKTFFVKEDLRYRVLPLYSVCLSSQLSNGENMSWTTVQMLYMPSSRNA